MDKNKIHPNTNSKNSKNQKPYFFQLLERCDTSDKLCPDLSVSAVATNITLAIGLVLLVDNFFDSKPEVLSKTSSRKKKFD